MKTANKIDVYECFFGASKTKYKVNNLKNEADMLDALNKYRRDNNLCTARNAYSWWKYILTAIAFSKDSITIAEACELVESRLNVTINRTVVSQLVKAVKGQTPCKIRREYTRSLPYLTKTAGLKFEKDTVLTNRGRRSLRFYFENIEHARKVLFATSPETKLLFDTLKKIEAVNA